MLNLRDFYLISHKLRFLISPTDCQLVFWDMDKQSVSLLSGRNLPTDDLSVFYIVIFPSWNGIDSLSIGIEIPVGQKPRVRFVTNLLSVLAIFWQYVCRSCLLLSNIFLAVYRDNSLLWISLFHFLFLCFSTYVTIVMNRHKERFFDTMKSILKSFIWAPVNKAAFRYICPDQHVRDAYYLFTSSLALFSPTWHVTSCRWKEC